MDSAGGGGNGPGPTAVAGANGEAPPAVSLAANPPARLLKKRWPWGVALLLGVGSVLGVFLKANHAYEMADIKRARRDGRPIPVRTALVAEKHVEEVIGATALTAASETAPLIIGASGEFSAPAPISDIKLKALHIHDGDRVQKGQLLLELDDEPFKQFVNQRQAGLDAAKATLARVKQEIEYNQKIRHMDVDVARADMRYRTDDLERRKMEYEAIRKLESQNTAASVFQVANTYSAFIAARFALEAAKDTLERKLDALTVGVLHDKEQLAIAVKDVEAARVALTFSQRDLRRTQMKSPVDGFVGLVTLVPGQTLTVNAVLLQVFKLDPIHVLVDFPQERIDDVFIGQPAQVVLDSFPKETFSGSVIRILPQVNSQLRVLPVEVKVDNPKQRIKAGISGYVRLGVNKRTKVVPEIALFQQGGKAMAFRIEDGKVRARPVYTGHLVETGMREVVGGLEAGDEVVVFPGNFYEHSGELTKNRTYLQDGDPVDANWRKWARRDD